MMNIQRYLHRIGVKNQDAPSRKNLTYLMQHHLQTVPFENLDIHLKRPIELETESLYHKIVQRNRGGFCYELNGLFAELLKELGYAIHMISARVYNQRRGAYGPEFDHLALIVSIEGNRYLADVGFGETFRTPLQLPQDEISDISGRYRLIQEYNMDNTFVLQQCKEENWVPEYRFELTYRELSEFEPMCLYHQTSPDSHFTQRMMCSLATENGRITLSDNSLIVTIEGKKKRHHISENEKPEILQKYFAVRVDGQFFQNHT